MSTKFFNKWKNASKRNKFIFISWIITFILMISFVIVIATLKSETKEKKHIDASSRWIIQKKTYDANANNSFYKKITNREKEGTAFDQNSMEDLLKKIGYDYSTTQPVIVYESVGASRINNPGQNPETKSVELIMPEHTSLIIHPSSSYANIIAALATAFVLSLLFSIGLIVITKYNDKKKKVKQNG